MSGISLAGPDAGFFSECTIEYHAHVACKQCNKDINTFQSRHDFQPLCVPLK